MGTSTWVRVLGASTWMRVVVPGCKHLDKSGSTWVLALGQVW